MPATTESHHGHGHNNSHGGGSFLSRISITRRTQVASMDVLHEQEQPELEHLDLFQQNVAHRFSNMLPSSIDHSSGDHNNNSLLLLLSIAWIRKLLDSFLACEAEFKAVLIDEMKHRNGGKALFDQRRLVHDLLDRYVKALDICNAVSHGVESIRVLQKQGLIVVAALEHRPFGDGQNFRAKKALLSLRKAIGSSDEKETVATPKLRQKTWSMNHRSGAAVVASTGAIAGSLGVKERSMSNSRTGSSSSSSSPCGVSKIWSVTKQIQAMTSALVMPRCNSDSSSPGLALPVYAMSCVTVFVMWVLAAAVPCQDRNGLASHLPVPKHSGWAHAMLVLQEKVSEEWKMKERKGSCGLLQEIHKMDRSSKRLVEFTDSFRFPLDVEEEDQIAMQVGELREICDRMDHGLAPLQSLIREVFHRIVKSRTEILELLDHSAKVSITV